MKSNLDTYFKSDKNLEKNGIWIEISEGVRFLIRRMGGDNSNAVKAAMAKHYKPYARLIEKGTMPVEREKAIMVKLFVESCLVDWEGVEVDGQLLEFSVENAIEILTELPELADLLVEQASISENYKEDVGK